MPASPAFTFSGVGTSLAKKSVAATTSFSATLDSIASVDQVEWSISSTDETSVPANYALTPSGSKGETVTLTSLGAGTAALLQCRINGGVDKVTGNPSEDMTVTAKFYVPTTLGSLEVLTMNEVMESSSTFGWLGVVNAAIRKAAAAASGAITLTGTAPITIDGDNAAHDLTAPRTVAIVAASGAVAGSMSAAHYTLVNNATATATASTIAKWDASKKLDTAGFTVGAADTFDYSQAQNTSGAGNDATFTGQRGKAAGAFIGGGFTFVTGLSGDGTTPSGNFKVDLGAEGVGGDSGRSRWVSAGGTLDLYSLAAVWQITTANGFVLAATGASTAKVQGPAGFLTIDATAITLSAANLGINGGADFGSGTGVVSLANAAVDPTVNPTGGVVIYASGGAGKCRGSGGTVTTFGPAEPHCPTCGRDFAHEWRNDGRDEHLAVCMPCMLGEMAKAGLNIAAFAFVNTMKP